MNRTNCFASFPIQETGLLMPIDPFNFKISTTYHRGRAQKEESEGCPRAHGKDKIFKWLSASIELHLPAHHGL